MKAWRGEKWWGPGTDWRGGVFLLRRILFTLCRVPSKSCHALQSSVHGMREFFFAPSPCQGEGWDGGYALQRGAPHPSPPPENLGEGGYCDFDGILLPFDPFLTISLNLVW